MMAEANRTADTPAARTEWRLPLGQTFKWGLLVGAALLPVLLLGLVAVYFAARSVHALMESGNATAASISAELVGREFDRSIGLGQVIAELPGMTEAVDQHDEEAVRSCLKPIVQSFPSVDRLFVTDLSGVLWSDYPPARESLGRSFADRDWYRGVTNGWAPYVSEVYQRFAEPRFLVVAIAVPLRNPAGALYGILVLQHRLDRLAEWLKRIPMGEGGYVFLVDHTGTVAAHPRLNLKARFYEEYFDVPLVKDGLRGWRGSGSYRDPFSGVQMSATIRPVAASHGHWVVVACQPAAKADEPARLLLLQIEGAAGLLAVMAVAVVLTLGRISQRNLRLSRQLTIQNDELKSLSASLGRQTAELEAANRELEAFSYSVSHDLRAPLRSMDGFSLALLEDYGAKLDAEAKDYLARIRSASQRMSALIDELLDLSRVSRGPMKCESVDLSAQVQALADQLQAEQPGRTVHFSIQPGVRAEGDPRLLAIALENLLRNAWKFTMRRPDPVIEFRTVRQEGKSWYFVRDNGAGFDMAHAGKLFTPFQRLHSTTEYPGTGIGLAIVRRIVGRHGGTVRAEGRVGEGATFFFSLGGSFL